MKGYTPTLTPEVSVEDFRAIVLEVGVGQAAERLRVSASTIQNWCMGYGTPQPRTQPRIERFVRAAEVASTTRTKER